ncbi:succinate-semialdehyde dehydrogenase [Bradyrhizobium oligotrophicum S58]|uniref:Succinate-semialdehyde dehydrogenase n=1 Tax=Bradyrhizobium oligotrophicum S58 TaxID=1245469 RepID=M4Z1V7_9BRAD|nr:aldehyde dehydrogenase family protein [Bradyrhizobium oligotrophicum]BAM86979.1 succinate-semialdehyde dehydrogenase [Bradyrhizobium oligotrophicum S58]
MHTLSASANEVTFIVQRARIAQKCFEGAQQREIDLAVAAAGWRCYRDETAQELSSLAIEETELGNAVDSYQRLRKRILGTLRDLADAVTVGLVHEDVARGVRKFAKPVGVIAGITPATAPAAAAIVNSLSSLKTRNAIIFCPNPRAHRTVGRVVELVRDALREVGAPVDLVQCVGVPTRSISEELMATADLTIASGGASTVRRAYRSGKPALGAGVGNAVVVVDDTADLDAAASMIIAGKSFDYGTSCSSESCILVDESVSDQLIGKLVENGAYMCSGPEMASLRRTAWPDGELAREIVGKSAKQIADRACIEVPQKTRVLLTLPETTHAEPLGGEKLSPILALWKFAQFDHAVGLVQRLVAASGAGHSCAIHTNVRERAEILARTINVSRVLVNQSTGMGNSGSFDNGLPFSVTLSCGTWGGGSTTDNVNWRHFLNYTWLSETIPKNEPRPEDLFSEYWSVYHPTASYVGQLGGM